MTDEASEASHCLVISDGRRGIENQALGLAESCAMLRPLVIQPHTIAHGKALAALPPTAQLRLAKFDLPACDLAIGCGRQAIAPLLDLKRRRPKVMTIYIQDPRIDPSSFDMVFAPEHDGLSGPNVMTMIGSPNRVTKPKLDEAKRNFARDLSKYAAPRAAILIGGTSKTHHLDLPSHEAHIEAALHLRAAGYSLLMTTSRRTPDFAKSAWARFAAHDDQVWIYEAGANPYFAFLGSADCILVTEDSTNMLTEACATGKPVFRLPMAGQPGKFQKLYDALETRCGVIRYDGHGVRQDYEPLNETARIAQAVWSKFDKGT